MLILGSRCAGTVVSHGNIPPLAGHPAPIIDFFPLLAYYVTLTDTLKGIPSIVLMKILVVDDSAALHQIYQITLARYKCPVLAALNGQEGLNLLAINPDINLLIVDMHMPGMNGLEFINRVKEQEAFNSIPVIAVFSQGQEETRQETILLAGGILEKPFTSTEIHKAVEKLFPQAVLEPKPILT